MKQVRAGLCLVLLMASLSCSSQPGVSTGTSATAQASAQPPSVLFGDFFDTVALSNLFPDSKQWADAIPKRPPGEILERAEALDTTSPGALRTRSEERRVGEECRTRRARAGA